ncbi:MAG: DMT family transporter, partial [Streptosporangiaceae bacterium]
LVAAVLLGVGFVLQQYAAQKEPESRFLSLRIITDLIRKPRWLAGIACMVAGQLLAAWSIGSLELTLVEPLLTTYLLFALLLAVPLSKQSIRWPEAGGALVLIAGVTLLSLSRSTKPIGLSIGSFSHWPTAAIIAGLAFVAVQVGHNRSGPARATLTGLGAGLVFGIQDALTRQTLEILQAHGVSALFTTWAPYCLLGAGIVGLWLMQNAFSAGPLHSSLPTIAAGEPVAGIALGIVVFGDRIQITPGMLAIEAGGIAALIVGVVLVARSSAFGRLSTITDAIKPHHGEAPAPGQRRSLIEHGSTPPDGLPAWDSHTPPEGVPARNGHTPPGGLPARNGSTPPDGLPPAGGPAPSGTPDQEPAGTPPAQPPRRARLYRRRPGLAELRPDLPGRPGSPEGQVPLTAPTLRGRLFNGPASGPESGLATQAHFPGCHGPRQWECSGEGGS